MIFGTLNPTKKNYMKILQVCPPHMSENVTIVTCELLNFFLWLKFCCVLSKVWGSKEPVVGCRWWLWKEPVVMCGNWNVRQAISQQVFRLITFCVNICFQFYRHWSVAQHITLCWNSAHVITSRCRKPQHHHANRHTSPVMCQDTVLCLCR